MREAAKQAAAGGDIGQLISQKAPFNLPRTPFRGAGWADRLSLTPRSATEPEVVHLAERRIVEELTEWGLVPGA